MYWNKLGLAIPPGPPDQDYRLFKAHYDESYGLLFSAKCHQPQIPGWDEEND
jgi:hypothetical protein